MSCTITTSTLFKILKQYEHLKLLSRSFHAAFPQKHTPDITGLSNQEAAVQRCSVKKVFLAISQNSMEETCAKASFSQACNFIKKKRPWHKCFPVNFVKFLRTPFLTEHLRWLLLVKRRTLDTFSNYRNSILLFSDFNTCVEDEPIKFFCSSYCLNSLSKEPTGFENSRS